MEFVDKGRICEKYSVSNDNITRMWFAVYQSDALYKWEIALFEEDWWKPESEYEVVSKVMGEFDDYGFALKICQQFAEMYNEGYSCGQLSCN